VFKILFFGDVFGRPGRETIKTALPALGEKYSPDLVIANGENLAHGNGITPKTLEELTSSGVEVVTGGDHIFDNAQGANLLDDSDVPVIRPLNWNARPGRGFLVWRKDKLEILLISLMGQVFMKRADEEVKNPFAVINDFLSTEKKLADIKIKIIDFHAEATSEKVAMGHFLDGKVSAVLGTHTHIQTADSRILSEGTGYVTDVGMCGSYNSVIGLEKKPVLESYLAGEFGQADPEEAGRRQINAIFLKIDEKSGKCLKIETVNNVFA
jgi:metallophosphoesterase (TIGR00282 family)